MGLRRLEMQMSSVVGPQRFLVGVSGGGGNPGTLGMDWAVASPATASADTAGASPVSDGSAVGRFALTGPRSVVFTQGTGALQPVYRQNRIIGVAGSTDQVVTAASLSVNARSLSLFCVVELDTTARAYENGLYALRLLWVTGGSVLNFGYDGSVRQWLAGDGAGGGGNATSLRATSGKCLIGVSSTAAGVVVRLNDTEQTVSAVGAQTGTGLRLLSDQPDATPLGLQGHVIAVATAPFALSAGQRGLLWQWAQALGCVSEATAYRVYGTLADSRGAGFLSPTNNSWVNRLNLSGAVQFNMSEAGCLASDLPAVATTLAGYKQSGKPMLVDVVCGINDIRASVGASTIYGNLTTVVSTLKTAGAKAVIHTIPGATGLSGTQATQLSTLNASIAGNAAGADAVVDDAGLPHAADPSNTTYFPDGIHYSDLLHADIAAITQAAHDSLW